jgi:hypothetical protein
MPSIPEAPICSWDRAGAAMSFTMRRLSSSLGMITVATLLAPVTLCIFVFGPAPSWRAPASSLEITVRSDPVSTRKA